jgi:hypothetical protein
LKRDISDQMSAIRKQERRRLKSSRLKVKELGKSTDDAAGGSGHTPAQRTLKFAEKKRDGNTEFTEGRTQRSQRKARKEEVEELKVES